MMFTQAGTHAWVDRGWYVVTEFERTPSINFQRAVELAQIFPGFTALMDERKILIYRNIYREHELTQFQEMVKLIKNWKGSKLYLNGERTDFDMLGNGIPCYIQTVLHQKIPTGCQHFNSACAAMQASGYIGCRRSRVRMTWNASQTEEPTWFAFGRLDQNDVYRIHKEQLEDAVIGELVEYRSCPLIHLEALRKRLRQLPERIDPRKDREWRYIRRERQPHAPSRFHGIMSAHASEVLPISQEAYRAYLKRMRIV